MMSNTRFGLFVLSGLGLSAVLAGLAMWLAAGLGTATAQSITLDTGLEGASTTQTIVQLIALLTVLSLAPSILVMITSFTRIIVVLSFLRQAMGVQQSPPNNVLISLALFLTFFIMAPVFEQAWTEGIFPLINEQVETTEGVERALAPFRTFMLAHVRESDLELFLGVGQFDPDAIVDPEDVPTQALIPAFMISELKRAFEIGFLLYLPFLIIDMVVASILLSMGMMMLPPVIISLPFKLIFFVLVDGWSLIVGSLVESYGINTPLSPG